MLNYFRKMTCFCYNSRMLKTTKIANKNAHENVALYTKYRPKKFNEVLGQEHVTAVLRDSLGNDNISHAYLFAGSRGTGKTSVARILAAEIKTSSNDLFEIDAASNNGVDEIRALNESVNTLPFNSNYKVYILDEVHMLSKSAFNALLKTLEEPPRHVIFVLATTELEKIPETVISRCEVYNFKTPNRETLKQMIVSTAKAEGYTLGEGVDELISIIGDGSFRDTHTILQKLIRSSTDTNLDLKEVEKITGAPKSKMINDCVQAVATGDIDLVFVVTKNISESNIDVKVFVRLFLEKFRAGIVLRIAPNKAGDLEGSFSSEDLGFLKKLVAEHVEVFNAGNLFRLLETFELLGRSSMPVLAFELVLVEIISKKS